MQCDGFFGAGFAEFVLNLYWGQFQMLYILLQGITELPNLGVSEWLFVLVTIIPAAILCLPLAYPFWYLLVRYKRNKKEI